MRDLAGRNAFVTGAASGISGVFPAMSQSNWLHRLAIGGILVASLLAGECHAQGNLPDKLAQPRQQQSAPTPAPIVIKLTADPGYYTTDCQRPKDHEAADLCEQRRQAEAAEANVWWVKAQTYLGIFGAILVICSLVFTGWAAVGSASAAKAALKGVEIAERSMFEVEAPFLYPNKIDHTIEHDITRFSIYSHPSSPLQPARPFVHFEIKNFGAGAAIFKYVRASLTPIEDLGALAAAPLGPMESTPAPLWSRKKASPHKLASPSKVS